MSTPNRDQPSPPGPGEAEREPTQAIPAQNASSDVMTTLQARKIEHEIEKLAAEKAALELNRSPGARRMELLKTIGSLASVGTAIVALLGLWFSISRWQDELQQSREAREEEQLQRAFENISAPGAAKQLSGIAALRSALAETKSSRQRQVLAIMVNILAIEGDAVVRNAIVSAIRDLDTTRVERSTLSSTLGTLVDASRTLVTQGKLRNPYPPLQPDTAHQSAEDRARSIAEAIQSLVRAGARVPELSGIYCERCDFSKLSLSGVVFDNAILRAADFTGATLTKASFDGADLQGTQFVAADLQQAKLTQLDLRWPKIGRWSYVEERMYGTNGASPPPQVAISGPNFNCADLRGADFSRHPVFGFVSDSAGHGSVRQPPAMVSFGATFVQADLSGADFSRAVIYGSRRDDEPAPFPMGEGGFSPRAPYTLFYGGVLDTLYGSGWTNDASVVGGAYQTSIDQIRKAFSGTNWEQARFPGRIGRWLVHDHPPVIPVFLPNDRCTPRRQTGATSSQPSRVAGG